MPPQAFANGTNVNSPGFDTVGLALLGVFQSMTLSGWTYIMYRRARPFRPLDHSPLYRP